MEKPMPWNLMDWDGIEWVKTAFQCNGGGAVAIRKVLLRAYMGSSHGIGVLENSALCSLRIALSCNERISRRQCNGAML